jgi:hypothetical protein
MLVTHHVRLMTAPCITKTLTSALTSAVLKISCSGNMDCTIALTENILVSPTLLAPSVAAGAMARDAGGSINDAARSVAAANLPVITLNPAPSPAVVEQRWHRQRSAIDYVFSTRTVGRPGTELTCIDRHHAHAL